jgi:hypothetical protein
MKNGFSFLSFFVYISHCCGIVIPARPSCYRNTGGTPGKSYVALVLRQRRLPGVPVYRYRFVPTVLG